MTFVCDCECHRPLGFRLEPGQQPPPIMRPCSDCKAHHETRHDMHDIFRDIESELDIVPEQATEAIPVLSDPVDIHYDSNGIPSFPNRPTSAQLVEQINRTHGAQHSAAIQQAEREADARRNRGIAYKTAAVCLATANHDLQSAQMEELDKLAKQLYRAGTKLLRSRK